jgi:hypothetical protein
LYLRQSNSYLKLKESSGIDIGLAIQEEIKKQKSSLVVKDVLNINNYDSFLYPYRFNDEKEMTRYFEFKFIDENEVSENTNWNIKSENIKADGVIYGIISTSKESINSVKNILLQTSKGVEHIVFVLLKDFWEIENIVRECSAITTLKARECPSAKMDVIIENGFGGVIFHEACGHSLEATSVAKGLSVFCGKKGQKIASDLVTAVDDGTIENGWGSGNYDDEGNKTTRNVLIENGVLKNYLVDAANGRRMNEAATGCCRRQSYKYPPTSRMSNTFICNGTSTVEEMIKATKKGLYCKKMGGGSVNPVTGEFNFALSEGYLIKNGKITRPVKGATLVGSGSEILLNIDMVGNNLRRAQGMCGSMSGSIPADVGQPCIRVRNITVGGRGGK